MTILFNQFGEGWGRQLGGARRKFRPTPSRFGCDGFSASVGLMARGESDEHRRLKALALLWAQANGFAIVGTEVRVPASGYRADVCAHAPLRSDRTARTAIFECKQARADLLKDAHAEAATRRQLGELVARRAKLEELLAVHQPDLRRGESLFPEFDTWDFSGLDHRTYRAVLAELAKVQVRVLKGTKFAKMFRYACADVLYLVAEDNIFAEAEIPAGWGLLVRRGETLALVRPPPNLDAAPARRQALLENIALAATRAANRDLLAAHAPNPSRAPSRPRQNFPLHRHDPP